MQAKYFHLALLPLITEEGNTDVGVWGDITAHQCQVFLWGDVSNFICHHGIAGWGFHILQKGIFYFFWQCR